MSKKTLEVIKSSGNNAIIQIKDNQPTFLDEAKGLACNDIPESSFSQRPTKGHGRIESRQVNVFKAPKYLKKTTTIWKHIECIVKVHRKRAVFDTKSKKWNNSNEIAYYLSTTMLSAKEFCKIIQGHWSIENSNHHVRDVTLKEDSSRIRINPGIFARLRSFSLNIFRFNRSKNIARERYVNGLKFEELLKYKALI